MKKIIGGILLLVLIVIAYHYVSNFLCECEVKCKNCRKTSPNIEFSKKSHFFAGIYTASSDTIQLKNYKEKIIITNVWAEKSWFKNTNDCKNPKLETTDGYNVVLEFSKTNNDFIFNLMPLTTDKYGKYSNGINENKKEMRFVNLPDEIKIIVEERNPDDNIGWTNKIATDTIVLKLNTKKLITKHPLHVI